MTPTSLTVGQRMKTPRAPRRPVRCADGFTVSVQASAFHYSTPRDDEGPYTEYEVGFPSVPDDALTSYAEDETNPTETVYGWVPRAVVEDVIASHGGLVEGRLP